MSLFRTVSRIALALFGLLAVVLATLEHEDLILQEHQTGSTPAAGTGKNTTAAVNLTSVISCLNDTKADSGTEGTFRAESHHFRLAPASGGQCQPRVKIAARRTGIASLAFCPSWPKRVPLVGITELRL